jgi:hypothetical protein
MSKFVEGSYQSIEEALKAVSTLIYRGHVKQSIQLVGNTSTIDALSDDIEVATARFDELNKADRERLADYKSKIENNDLVALVEDSSIDDEEVSGARNEEANSPQKAAVTDPTLDPDATTENAVESDTPGHVSVGDEDDSIHSTPLDKNHDLTDKENYQ